MARNMTVFRVDPALLGLPSDAEVTATAVARPEPTPAATAAAPATARPAPGRKGALVPGQVMPESAVVDARTPTAIPTGEPARAGHGLARNMEAFRVDPALLDPADRIAAPAQAPQETPVLAATEAKKAGKPQPKLSVVPSAVAGGVYLPPVYAGAAKDRKTVPVYVTADRIDGTSGVQAVAKGNADLIKADSRLRGDEIIFREKEDEVEATGNVILTREGDEMSGPHLKLKLGDSVGYFESPVFRMDPKPSATRQPSMGPALPGYGTASRLEFQGEDHYHLDNATYSSCVPGEGQDWFAKVASLDLNYENSIGEARDATVYFKGVPLLYAPWLDFSLNRQRKSGFLSPTWGSTTNAGIEFSTPYYWNIAPEMDATIAPRIMAKRGTQWRGEFRYIGNNVPSVVGPSYIGTFNGEYLSNDKLTGRSRHAFSLNHTQSFGYGFAGNLNLNGVSDDDYFNDMSSSVTTIAQTNLVRQGNLSYGAGWWSTNVLVQRYQTLRPAGTTVTSPYERLPQVTLNASRPDLPLGLAFNLSGEYVSFSNPDKTLVQGQRTTAYPQLSLPLQTASFYVTPKVGIHNTRYQLSQQAVGTPDSLTRSVPIVSVDSGLVFERDTSFNGRALIQTLEPRLYYLRVPLRDQSNYPVFDTGVADFNFAQIFAENSFSGGDRIADANQATLAVSSRLISPNTGAELVKVAAGQRWYFSDQSVVLPGQTPRSGHLADYLGALTVQMEKSTSLDSAIQYNPRDKRVERFNLGMRYQPETARLLNAGYRFSRDLLHQVDVSGQWPVSNNWSAVGRYNYSFRDKKLVENILGMEYNEACWAVRFVVQRVATTTGQINSTFFVQLQLNGFSSLGSSPMNLLRRSVSGYDKVVEPDDEESDQP
ncbi:LPS-assembly protein LptD [Denitratisoma sp. agr-D3]